MFYKADTLLINPVTRPDYKKIEGYPEVVILGHSTRWPEILSSISISDPNLTVLNHSLTRYEETVLFLSYGRQILYIFASEGSLSLHTKIVKAAFNGAKYIINIGCSGSINENLNIGDIVICNCAVRDSGFGNLLATHDQIAVCSPFLNTLLLNSASNITNKTKSFPKSILGNVWCVNTLYYTKENVLEAKAKGCDIVEMEMETGAITTGWLNENFFNDNPIHYSQISYISDKLPINGEEWTDVFTEEKSSTMLGGKRDSLSIVLEVFKDFK